jgi:hypothetical protein
VLQQQDHDIEKELTPLIFSPFGIKYQKEKRKEEKSTHSSSESVSIRARPDGV